MEFAQGPCITKEAAQVAPDEAETAEMKKENGLYCQKWKAQFMINCAYHFESIATGKKDEAKAQKIDLTEQKEVDDVLYPVWLNSNEIQKVKRKWPARQGDVVIASSWPIRGLQRLFVAMVEGKDPWEQGLVDKPHFLEAAASTRGADDFIDILASWPGRRLFKTHCLPTQVPFQWPPTEEDIRNGTAPKVVVLICDPRYAMSLIWEVVSTFKIKMPLGQPQPTFGDFISAVVENKFQFFVDPFKHAMAWANEAAQWPDHVQLIQGERFASLDPKEVKAACAEFAEFIGIAEPAVCASGLVTAVANRPRYAASSLAKDIMLDPEAIRGGPLVELLGPRVQNFESSLAPLSYAAKSEYRRLLFRMMESPFLVDLARRAAYGVCSVPPLKLCAPMKGEAAHAAGTCRMCVFALRGQCRNTAEMCPYCHLPGHDVPKRPSRAKRMQRRAAAQARCRTPSVDGLSS